MKPSPQPRPQKYTEVRQESRSGETRGSFFDESLRADQRSEDSSNCSNRMGGSGSGSGAGYSADYSSSDSSSLSSKQKTSSPEDIQQQVGNLSLRPEQDQKATPSKPRHETGASSLSVQSKDYQKDRTSRQRKAETNAGDRVQNQSGHPEVPNPNASPTLLPVYGLLPQLNGVRVAHPMDPRIDLSTVGYNRSINGPSVNCSAANNVGNHVLSLDHYLHLMEVRTFKHFSYWTLACLVYSL